MKINVFKVFSSGKRAKFSKVSVEADSFELAWDLFTHSLGYSDKYRYHLIDEQGNLQLFPTPAVSETVIPAESSV